MKYYKQYFKPFPNYKSDGRRFVSRLSTLILKEFIKIKSEANPYDKSVCSYFINRYLHLKMQKPHKILAQYLSRIKYDS